MSNSIEEIEDAQTLFVIGSNTTEAHPDIAIRMKKAAKNGAKLIVADPRKIPLVQYADLWLRLRPGTDIALLNSMMHVILEENLHDPSFIEERTNGFDDFSRGLKEFTPELGEKISGVPKDDIIRAARMFASSERAGIYYTLGITQHTHGTNNVFSIANLALLTGNLGKESAGVNPLRGQNNVQGACDMGCTPDVLPGYQKVTDQKVREKFEEMWGRPIPDKVGLTSTDMIGAMIDGRLKGLYVMGENSVLSHAHMSHTIQALENLDFLVVQDIFLTETAKLADVVLPAASFAEKNGTFTNTERRVQRVRKAIQSPGEALDDLTIIGMLSSRMGYDHVRKIVQATGFQALSSGGRYAYPEQAFREVCFLSPAMAGMTYLRLAEKGLQWPCPDQDHPGTPFLFKDGFPKGRAAFTRVSYEPSRELPDSEYPLVLTTGRNLYQYHTGTMTRKSKAIEAVAGQAYVEISSTDAEHVGIGNSEMVTVSSRRGAVSLQARVGNIVPPGVLYMPFHYAEAPANALTNSVLDPICRIPELKVCAVKIEKSG